MIFSGFCLGLTDKKIQCLLCISHPHVVPVGCCLHLFNLLVKDICALPLILPIVKNNKVIVNFFTKSHYWGEFLDDWRAAVGAGHTIQNFCLTRWFSMAKVCLSVSDHEPGFIKCLTLLNNPLIDTPEINKDVQNIINDRDHFTGNQVLIKILRPIVDSLARLERADTTLGDVWKELGIVYCSIQDIEVYEIFEPLKLHALSSLHTRSKQFQLDIYMLAFFLDPVFREVATSKKYTVDWMARQAVELACKWGCSRSEGYAIKSQVPRYHNGDLPFNMTGTCKSSLIQTNFFD